MKHSFQIRINNNIHNVAEMEEALLVSEVPKEAPKKSGTALKYKSSSYAIAPNMRKQLFEIENQMT